MCMEFNIRGVCSISPSWEEIGNAALALLKRLLGAESLGVTLCIQPPAKYLIEPWAFMSTKQNTNAHSVWALATEIHLIWLERVYLFKPRTCGWNKTSKIIILKSIYQTQIASLTLLMCGNMASFPKSGLGEVVIRNKHCHLEWIVTHLSIVLSY